MDKITNQYVFQADNSILEHYYQRNNNYKIVYNYDQPKKYCVIYFSSNNIYFPNTIESFQNTIINKDRYEWYGNKLAAYKHIYLRDIKKQWYLTGINSQYSNPEELLRFLKRETEGYNIVSVGSSAGGFAAVLFGSLLGAEKILSFNGQFELFSLLQTSNPSVDPIIFRNKTNEDLLRYYEVSKYITNPSSIFYFYSMKSKWDKEQFEYVKKKKINYIGFNTDHHGVPFLKCNLPKILSYSNAELLAMTGCTYSPLLFSLKHVGLKRTILGILNQLKDRR